MGRRKRGDGGAGLNDFPKGTHVWARHDTLAWAKGHVADKSAGKVTVKLESGGNVTVDAEDVELCSTTPSQEAKVEDLTKLSDLHHPALLSALNERFKKDRIYTYTGPILIAVNPFKKLSKLYEQRNMMEYLYAPAGTRGELPPHAWNLAHNAYEAMCMHQGRNQSILVSGESGAGKTVSTKIVLEYFTIVASNNPKAALGDRGGQKLKRRSSSRMVSQRLMEANPLMEAFGNAKTLRNDNSSRFGKLIQLQFDEVKFALVGAFIDIYLLEKCRVVGQLDGERNYHIFYELEQGLSAKEKKAIEFPPLKECRYTNQSKCLRRSDLRDEDQFKDTLKAFDVLGFAGEERDAVFRLMSALLHLGNVDFEDAFRDGEEGSKVTKRSQPSLEACARLLRVTPGHLEDTLTQRGISIGGGGTNMMKALAKMATGENVIKQHTPAQSAEMRDGLAQTLYNQVFAWLVWRINEQTTMKASKSAERAKSTKVKGGLRGGGGKKSEREYYNDFSIGCLDIFGFEVFEQNGFEQLLINYTNERLQNQFNEFVFRLERAEYESEGINWAVIDFPDNSACLAMIEGRPLGLLKLVDEECLYPKGTDQSLAQKLYSNLGKRHGEHFIVEREMRLDHKFCVAHFAGDVVYDTAGFCRKNKNELRQEAVDLMRASKVALFAMLLPPDAASGGGGSDPTKHFAEESSKPKTNYRSSLERHKRVSRSTSKLQSQTVSANFRAQLQVAMEHIRHSEPHYVRCIKSNDLNAQEMFDRPRVEEQLCYSGVLEVVKVARAGYGTRFSMDEFAHRYACLAARKASSAKKAVKAARKTDKLSLAKKILGNSGLADPQDFQIGRTKVFLKAQSYNRLEALRGELLHEFAVVIQRAVRAWLVRWRKNRKLREKLAREREERARKEELERKRRSKLRREKEEKERLQREQREAKERELERKRQSKLRREAEERRRKEEERLAKERKKKLEQEEKEAKAARAREAREARVAERERQRQEKARREQERREQAEREAEEKRAREEEERLRLLRAQQEQQEREQQERNEQLQREASTARERLRSTRLQREADLLLLKQKSEGKLKARAEQRAREREEQERREQERKAEIEEIERKRLSNLRRAKESKEALKRQASQAKLAKKEKQKEARLEKQRRAKEAKEAKAREKERRRHEKEARAAEDKRKRMSKLRRNAEEAEQLRLEEEAQKERLRREEEEHQALQREEDERLERERQAELDRLERKRFSELRRADEAREELRRQQALAKEAKKKREQEARKEKERRVREEKEAKARAQERKRYEKAAKAAEQERKRLSKLRRVAESKHRKEEAKLLREQEKEARREQERIQEQLEQQAREEKVREKELLKEEKERKERLMKEQEEKKAQEARERAAREEIERARTAHQEKENEVTELRAKNERLRREVDEQRRLEKISREKALAERQARQNQSQRLRSRGGARQRAAMVLQGVARVIESRDTPLPNDFAERAADTAVTALQGFARKIAVHKTKEMEEQEEQADWDAKVNEADKDSALMMVFFACAAIVFWFPALLGFVIMMAFAIVPAIEAREHRIAANDPDNKLLPSASSASLRSKAPAQRAYGSGRSTRTGRSGQSARSARFYEVEDLSDDEESDFSDVSFLSDDDDSDEEVEYEKQPVRASRSQRSLRRGKSKGVPDDLAFFEQHKSSSRMLTKNLTKHKGLLSRKNSFASSDGSESMASASSPRRGRMVGSLY